MASTNKFYVLADNDGETVSEVTVKLPTEFLASSQYKEPENPAAQEDGVDANKEEPENPAAQEDGVDANKEEPENPAAPEDGVDANKEEPDKPAAQEYGVDANIEKPKREAYSIDEYENIVLWHKMEERKVVLSEAYQKLLVARKAEIEKEKEDKAKARIIMENKLALKGSEPNKKMRKQQRRDALKDGVDANQENPASEEDPEGDISTLFGSEDF